MWKSLFLAIGIAMVLFGVECLGVEKMVLTLRGLPPPKTSFFDTEIKLAPPHEFTPKPWLPWTMMSTGAVVCLYSFTIPKRIGSGG